MFYDAGCYGGVRLGELPEAVQQRLAALPGDWLEFDAPTGMIVVRHIQPSAGPCLPTITGELVRMLAEIPEASQAAIPGGELFVHTERGGQLVRLKVEAGGAVKIEWAHPDYTRAHAPAVPGRAPGDRRAAGPAAERHGHLQDEGRRARRAGAGGPGRHV